MEISTIKIENGVIALPKALQKLWENQTVFLLPGKNRLTIQSLDTDWDEYEKKIVTDGKKISNKLIEEAVVWAKKQTQKI